MSHSITIPSPDGTGEFTLYVAVPVQEPRAALLVIQEIYGVNADIRHKCDLPDCLALRDLRRRYALEKAPLYLPLESRREDAFPQFFNNLRS